MSFLSLSLILVAILIGTKFGNDPEYPEPGNRHVVLYRRNRWDYLAMWLAGIGVGLGFVQVAVAAWDELLSIFGG
jgi:hypothetical protein